MLLYPVSSDQSTAPLGPTTVNKTNRHFQHFSGSTIKFTSTVTCNTVQLYTENCENCDHLFFCLATLLSIGIGLQLLPPRPSLLLLVVEFPRLATHRALLVGLRVEPLHDAVHVEAVRAGPPDERTIVPGQRTIRTAALEGHPTDTAVVIVGEPFPHGDSHPTFHGYFHSR